MDVTTIDYKSHDLQARIKVVGIGGGGCNALDRMIESGLEGVDFIALNTDYQALGRSQAAHKVQVGQKLTKGLGAGSNPEVGRRAAEESRADIAELVEGSDLVFVTCGMGGGTGTGGSATVASIAREAGALTVGIVSRPFKFEGRRRSKVANEGINQLREQVDTLIVIPNDRLLDIVSETTSLQDSFLLADDILRQAVTGISELILKPGLINLDFADVKMVMENSGTALIGLGEASGENRAVQAVQQAIQSPLLESSIDGARGVLINFIGGRDMSLQEVNQAAELISDRVDEDANIIFGATMDEEKRDRVRVMILATGFRVEPFENASKPRSSSKINKIKTEPESPAVKLIYEDNSSKVSPSKTAEGSASASSASSAPADDDEDLDIPAFLRRIKK
ncbi:cell division protein FtsZ [bacterium]|nr:cell division protein FtsZ [bacterium]